MRDEKLWRREGPKELLEFLSVATDEDYDAAVYDTKLQFDTANIAAVRYVASVAMAKASRSGEVLEEPMPDDGSVCPYDVVPETEAMRSLYEKRLEKEAGLDFYLPDSSAYSDAVIHAIERRNILLEDRTEDERRQMEESAREARRSDSRYMLLHYYLPIAFAFFSLLLILYKLSH